MSDEVETALDDWWIRLRIALALEDVPADRDAILGLAGDAAHAIVRPAAPITTFLAGYAAGLAGGIGFGEATLRFDLPVMIAASVALAGFVVARRDIGRAGGLMFILCYAGFLGALILGGAGR